MPLAEIAQSMQGSGCAVERVTIQNQIMRLITLLLTAILITLLGAWIFIGVSVLIFVIVIATIVIISVIAADISESAIGNYLRNTSRIKKLKQIIKRKSDLGYMTDEYEEEVTYLQNNKLNKSEFGKVYRDS